MLKLLEKMTEEKNNETVAPTDKLIQVKLPGDMVKIFDDIKEIRSTKFESLSNVQITIDAVKKYHEILTGENA